MDKSKTHFVLVAGFSSDHLETTGLKNSLEKKGFSVDAISFYGNSYIDDFTHLRASDCIENVSSFINKRAEQYDSVFGIGVSLGGALFLEHAKQHDNLKGIISIGTPFKLKNRTLLAAGQKFIPVIYIFWKRMQKIKFLRLSPIGAVNTVVNYLEGSLPQRLDEVKTPVLLLHSKKDHVSDYRVLPKYLDLISSEKKKLTFFKNGSHTISHDPDLVVEYALDFLEIN